MEIGQGELLVGTVRVVVVLPPAEQQGVGLQRLVEIQHDGDRSALAGIDRLAAEGVLDRPGGRRDVGAVQRDHDAGRAVMVDQFPGHARRTGLGQPRPSAAVILAGSWCGTRRKLNFAPAAAGRTVFAPAPWYPPPMPQMSNVGLPQRRSSIV